MRESSERRLAGTRRLRLEELDSRLMLATDLSVVDIFVRDSDGNPTELIIGKEVAIEVAYVTEDLPSNATHHLEVTIGGRTLKGSSSDCAAGFSSGNCSWWISGWFLGAGSHDVTARLVADNFEDENASNNVATESFSAVSASPPFTLEWPLEYELNRGVYLGGYMDVDPTDNFADFGGNDYSYDSHNGTDYFLADFVEQDIGVEVRAAAGGVVIESHDGNFDRQTEWLDPEPPSNYVVIDHGDGWTTGYWHLRRDSVAVNVGASVTAGALLGYIGSSGVSDSPHLHLTVQHDGQNVETMMDQVVFWGAQMPYYGQEKQLVSSGVSNYDVIPHLSERPSEHSKLDDSSSQAVNGWAKIAGVTAGDVVEFVWKSPDGNVFARDDHEFVAASTLDTRVWSHNLPENPMHGVWSIDIMLNGQVLGSQTFEVSDASYPEIRVERLGEIIVDGRVTPIDFGTAAQSESVSRLFQIRNHGDADLFVSAVEVPQGFIVRGVPTPVVPPGGLGTVTIELDTESAGYFAGEVVIHSSDLDERFYEFSVEGEVTSPSSASLRLGVSDRRLGPNREAYGTVKLESSRSVDVDVDLSSAGSDVSVPQRVTIPAGETSARFLIETGSTDESSVIAIRATATGYSPAHTELTLNAVANGGAWQNAASPSDVDSNGTITPLDALLVINELNDRMISSESTGAILPSAGSPPPYLDVDGSGLITPLDALLVINDLPSSRANNLQSNVPLSVISDRSDEEDGNDASKDNSLFELVFSESGTF